MRYARNSFRGFGGGGGFGFGYGLTPVVKRLLLINVAVFLLAFAGAAGFIIDWFAFQPSRLLVRPWGLVTYMFVHVDFMHLFANMLGLFFFGPPLEGKWGSTEFTRFYFVAGIGGILLSLLLAPSSVIGASGAIFGVMLAFAMNWPTAPIYFWGIFPIQAKWLVGFFFLWTMISAFGNSGGGVAHFAHLGGLLAALAYLKMDWRLPSVSRGSGQRPRKVRRLAIVPRNDEDEAQASQKTRSAPQERPDERQLLDAVDRVLDKISEQGMGSLTDAERKLLDEVSRRHRTN